MQDKDDFGFSLESRDWLVGWLSGGLEITNLPDVVVDETMDYSPETNEQLLLYHALTDNDVITKSILFVSDKSSSWTYTLKVARLFKTERPIISVLVGNSNVLIDTVQLEANYISRVLGGVSEEHEVILLPGTYRILIVED